MAVADKAKENELPRIYVYDIKTSKKLAVLGIPFEINASEFMRVLFTHDGYHLAALTAGPDYIMYYYNWKSGKIESQVRANNPPSTPGPLTDASNYHTDVINIVRV